MILVNYRVLITSHGVQKNLTNCLEQYFIGKMLKHTVIFNFTYFVIISIESSDNVFETCDFFQGGGWGGQIL